MLWNKYLMFKGKLIVFDGIDGSGKTYQIKLFSEWLNENGYNVVLSKEPTNGKYGSILRSSSNSRLPFEDELDYFLKDRDDHIENLILPSLKDDKIVLIDRYYYSTIAYQGVRYGDLDFIKEKVFEKNYLTPDITFIFDLPVDIALERIRTKRGDIPNEFESKGQLELIREIFLSFKNAFSEVIVINADNTIIHIHEILKKYFSEHIS
jgi:dTMP kinase